MSKRKGRGKIKTIEVRMLFVGIIMCFLVLLFGVCHFVSANKPGQNRGKGIKNCQEISVKVNRITHREKDIYTQKYQKETDTWLKTMKKRGEYTLTSPLVVENAYGTYTTSLYYYAEAPEACYAVCTITSDGAATLTHRMESGSVASEKQEYNLTGLVPGADNRIEMEFYNEKNEMIEKTAFDYKPAEDKQIPDVLQTNYGTGRQEMSDGLFTLFGHDKSKAANVYLFDNEGAKRGRIPLNDYRTDRLLFVGNQMVYSYDNNKIAFVNRLGKVQKTMNIGDYSFHHDFIYDEAHNSILILANKKGADTIEDRVLALDCASGRTREIIDFEKMMPEYKKSAVQRKGGKNTYGGTELDWIHFNSLDIVSGGEIILSSREHSSLIKVYDVYDSPKLDYIIHSGALYKGSKYDSLRLEKVGDFVGQAGQHTITVEHDSSLPEGQYYLYMFNNNFGNAATIPDFEWNLYPGVGQFVKGDHSSYYKYLVDEKERTYELVRDIHLPYSSIVSSVEHIGDNISFSSGMSKCFGEYDKEGKMIRTFYYDADKYSYRVMKYDFKGFLYH